MQVDNGVRTESLSPPYVAAWDYAALGIAVIVSRILFYALGLRFELVLDWMFLADSLDLRERLLETVTSQSRESAELS